MHRSIGVTLFLIASFLVPRQARALDPITDAVVAIIGTTSAALDLKDRFDVWTGLVESNRSMLNRSLDKDLLAARILMEQYNNAPNNKKLLQDARTHFTRAAGGYEGRVDGTAMYKRALSWLGVKMCCDVTNDRANARMALLKIVDIGLIPESPSRKLPDWAEDYTLEGWTFKQYMESVRDDKKQHPDYIKYLAVWEGVMVNLTNTKVLKRNDIWERANKLLLGKGGVKKDEAAGFTLMQLVATQGEVGAQYNVGNLYKDGVGVQRNYSQAAYWYRKAAEKGHRRARSELGNLYLNGRGVPQNAVEGTAWAALSSMNEARKYNIRISGVTLSPGDEIKVQKRVSELFKKYGKTK